MFPESSRRLILVYKGLKADTEPFLGRAAVLDSSGSISMTAPSIAGVCAFPMSSIFDALDSD